MKTSDGNRAIRFSMRGLLAAVVCTSVAFASLKYANNGWWIAVSSAALMWLLAVVIVALVDRGPRQAFAIGFLATVVTYGAVLLGSSKTEMYTSYTYLRLPTTQQLAWLYSVVEESRYIDRTTGKVVALENLLSGPADVVPRGSGIVGASGSGVKVLRSPEQSAFMFIGHVLWAVALGFVGGVFARIVYARRERTGEDDS